MYCNICIAILLIILFEIVPLRQLFENVDLGIAVLDSAYIYCMTTRTCLITIRVDK